MASLPAATAAAIVSRTIPTFSAKLKCSAPSQRESPKSCRRSSSRRPLRSEAARRLGRWPRSGQDAWSYQRRRTSSSRTLEATRRTRHQSVGLAPWPAAFNIVDAQTRRDALAIVCLSLAVKSTPWVCAPSRKCRVERDKLGIATLGMT